jgi:uncharacterized membrane protein (UPF0127 family)
MRLIQVQHLSTISQASIGLLSAKKAYPVYFKTRFGIHTFGMKFPIDVLVLDDKYRTVRMISGLVPNRLFVWPPIYYHVLELPEGYISKNAIGIGEKINLIYT